MPPPTANEIRAQLKTLLTPVIATSTTKRAKIIEYLAWAFREGSGEDPTNLRSELDQVALLEGSGVIDRVNCLMISDAGFTQVFVPAKPDSTRRLLMPRGKVIITRKFRMTYFYQFGEESEITFSDNVEVVRTTVNEAPKLGFADVVDYKAGPAQFIEGHSGLQMPAMLPDAFGETLVHVALGDLEVTVIEPLEGS